MFFYRSLPRPREKQHRILILALELRIKHKKCKVVLLHRKSLLYYLVINRVFIPDEVFAIRFYARKIKKIKSKQPGPEKKIFIRLRMAGNFLHPFYLLHGTFSSFSYSQTFPSSEIAWKYICFFILHMNSFCFLSCVAQILKS